MRIGRVCLNSKVLVGLGVTGIGIWAVAPNLFLAALPLLVLVVCPLSVLAMMWGMNHIMQSGYNSSPPTPDGLPPGQRDSLAKFNAQQAAINQEISELERGGLQARSGGRVGYRPNGNDGGQTL